MGTKFKLPVVVALMAMPLWTAAQNNTDAKSAELLSNLKKVNGGWEKLAAKKDVQFTYVYQDLAKGTDISTERYIFGDEASYGEYQKHEVNVMPGQTGVAKQSLIAGEPKITLNGKMIEDKMAVGGTQFLRSANYFWFTMMYKLDDPGTVHKYLGQEKVNGITYDKVSLSYSASKVGKAVNDEYILYFNPKTHLIDRFFFSLPAMGVNQPVMRMDLDYSKIEGIYVATHRKAFAPNEQGEYHQFLEFTTKDIKFDNHYQMSDLTH